MLRPSTRSRVVRMIMTVAFVGGSSLAAHAQIGSGWTQYAPTKKQDVRGSTATYSSSGGVETFTIYPGDQRSETRVNNNYTSGQRQFEGQVKVTAGTHKTCIYQTFGGSSTATSFMLVVHNVSGGQMRRYDNEVMASGIYGVWVRWNTIHDANANKITAYVNGSSKGTFADRGDATHYNKYGVYNISGAKSQSQWKSTRFWRK